MSSKAPRYEGAKARNKRLGRRGANSRITDPKRAAIAKTIAGLRQTLRDVPRKHSDTLLSTKHSLAPKTYIGTDGNPRLAGTSLSYASLHKSALLAHAGKNPLPQLEPGWKQPAATKTTRAHLEASIMRSARKNTPPFPPTSPAQRALSAAKAAAAAAPAAPAKKSSGKRTSSRSAAAKKAWVTRKRKG